MIAQLIPNESTRRRLLSGGMGRHVEGFAERLCERGYRPDSVTYRLRMVGAFGRWLDLRGIALRQVDDATVSRFLKDRWQRRAHNGADEPGLRLFLDHLRERGVIHQQRPQRRKTKLARVLQGYECHLVQERALATATREKYHAMIRGFLVDRFGARAPELRKLRAPDIVRYLDSYCSRFSVASAKLLVTALRSFLRYALIKGMIAHDLVPFIPTVAHWKRGGLPKAIPAHSCRRTSAM